MKINIPGVLKKHLINDWENITRKQCIVPLPRTPNVTTILKEWEDSKTKPDMNAALTSEVVTGLQTYFERALGSVLLYKFERPQFKVTISTLFKQRMLERVSAR